jgi:hypothetical protein
MFSHDADMLREAKLLARQNMPFGGLAFARPMGITIGEAIEQLELLALTSEPHDMVDRIEYLPI